MRLLWLLIVGVGALTYFNALGNPLLFDDVYLLEGNPLLADAAGLKRLLTEPGMTGGPIFAGHFRPLLMLTYWVEQQLIGDSIVGRRLVNLALHLACALLVGLLCRRLLWRLGWARRLGGGPDAGLEALSGPALAAASLFALLPLHAEAVNQLLKRNSSMSSLLMLAALLLLDRSFDAGRGRRPLIAAVVCGALALLVKEEAAVLPALVALYGWTTGAFGGAPDESGPGTTLAEARSRRARARRGPDRTLAWRKGALTVAAFAAAPLIFAALWFPDAALTGGESAGLRHLFAQPAALLEYLTMVVLPSRVAVVSGLSPAPWPPGAAQIAGLALLAATVATAGVLALRRRLPLGAHAVLWAAACLAPTSSIFPLPLVADPIRAYLASFGLVAAVGLGLALLGRRLEQRLSQAGRAGALLRAAPTLAAALLCCLGTLQVNDRMSDEQGAWRHALALHPDGALANANLCAVIARDHAPREAIPQCLRAARLAPDNPWVVQSIVRALVLLGRTGDAEQALDRARRRMGSRWQLALMEGHLAWFQDRLGAAARAYAEVLRQNPAEARARVYLADVRLRLGQAGARELIAPLAGLRLDAQTARLLASVRLRLPHSAVRPR